MNTFLSIVKAIRLWLGIGFTFFIVVVIASLILKDAVIKSVRLEFHDIDQKLDRIEKAVTK